MLRGAGGGQQRAGEDELAWRRIQIGTFIDALGYTAWRASLRRKWTLLPRAGQREITLEFEARGSRLSDVQAALCRSGRKGV